MKRSGKCEFSLEVGCDLTWPTIGVLEITMVIHGIDDDIFENEAVPKSSLPLHLGVDRPRKNT